MKRTTLGLVLFLLPLSGVAQDNTLKPDGTMWEAWNNSGAQSMFVKAAYVEGAIEGLRAGATEGYYAGRIDGTSGSQVPMANATEGKFQAGADRVRAEITPQHASVLEIVRQMDKLYSDYRNIPVCMIQAVQESIHSLNGRASSEKELEVMRKGCNP